MKTRVLPVDASKIGTVSARPRAGDILDELDFRLDLSSADARHLAEAAEKLRSSDVPVAFPTETVYGLGADATRSAAVKGIYKAKQRPSDNPLIVHFSSLKQLRFLLKGHGATHMNQACENGETEDPIPAIYMPLIAQFWPGPLTIILPNPKNSPLAPEVTAGLQTFGARMPRHVLASVLISMADVPVAAPSANASTKPSPTAAEHVAYDLDGRIETIIDGGPCDVGVESTVVDGLSDPPLVLRPGGISLDQIRQCPGWENTQIGYKNLSEQGSQPRAPGMKYRHYSPRATVILYESGKKAPTLAELRSHVGYNVKIGIIRTKSWRIDDTAGSFRISQHDAQSEQTASCITTPNVPGFAGMLQMLKATNWSKVSITERLVDLDGSSTTVLDLGLGQQTADIARGIFSALRDLDRREVDAIFVEGISDGEGETAAAIMNRLRKAAEIHVEE